MQGAKIILFFLILAAPLNLSANSETWKWKEINFDDGSQRYIQYLHEATCVVNVFRNGDVEILTSDFNRHSAAFQYIRITKGLVYINEIIVKVENAQAVLSKGYDIFDRKFKSHAWKLPPPVRLKFQGLWNVR